MADTTKNTPGTQAPSSTNPTSGTPSASGGQTGDRQGGQTGTTGTGSAARQARDQSSTGSEWGQSSTMDNVERGARKGMEMGSEMYGKAKENLSDAYDRASRSVSETWDQAVHYGRQNPGTATLIAFGAGIGVGLMIAGSMSSRNRSQRIVQPVMRALSEIASEYFG